MPPSTGLSSTFAMAPKTHEGFVAEQHRVMPAVVTVVIFWANVEAGFEALKHFARMNPGLLIVACKRGERKRGGSLIPGYKLLWNTNLANLGSATAFADKCTRELDVLKGRDVAFRQTMEIARRFGVLPMIAVVASDVHYWTTSAVESPSILANISSKEYRTPE
ncbi:hypothetical protein EDD85DRAFT_1026935 [Armillaria nabsnona]|nr:hypothetical protein EDD85DRAFT_1026935 [Armillaria nabsnona]